MTEKNVAEQIFRYCEAHCGKTPKERKDKGCSIFKSRNQPCTEVQAMLGTGDWNRD